MCRSLKRAISKELEDDWAARHYKAKEADSRWEADRWSNSWRWDSSWSGSRRPGSWWPDSYRDGQDAWDDEPADELPEAEAGE